jgi:hypothetical protein
MTYLARSGTFKNLVSPFSFFSAAEIHKSELFWHIQQDLREYGRFCQIVGMEMRKTCFCPRNIENKLK